MLCSPRGRMREAAAAPELLAWVFACLSHQVRAPKPVWHLPGSNFSKSYKRVFVAMVEPLRGSGHSIGGQAARPLCQTPVQTASTATAAAT